MKVKLITWFSCCFLLLVLYTFSNFQLTKAQIPGWKTYYDAGHKFNFNYPYNWQVKSSHDKVTGSTEVILTKPNSPRTQVSILYNPNDTLLFNSKTGTNCSPKSLNQLRETDQRWLYFFQCYRKVSTQIHNTEPSSCKWYSWLWKECRKAW
jgi:hypothetical protein